MDSHSEWEIPLIIFKFLFRQGDKRLTRNFMETSNKWINLKTWLGIVGKRGLLEEIKILRWCSYDLNFIPSK